ncbi:Ig-like domain-containing protein [Nocardioides piscis]|uniref:Signal peptidase I n=1 Tax=Nocardioides piscis TaxID=2714938 RepID=A0A6G7YG70_9ACTN|nr:Ig-like domain-containing protein [Nocardioides piscis]QIK75805.1 signal peptidase I [Nocardioides piscis]
MTRRLLLLIATTLCVGAVGCGMPGFSSASFTARTTNGGTITAAADWTPPTVSLQNPGSPLKGTVSVSASASDVETGVATVRMQFLPANASSWVTICTAVTAPYSCSWNTTSLADGIYELRAVATDNAGYSTTSASLSTTVANNLLVVLGDPGEIVRGTVSLPTVLYGAGATTYTVRVEYAPAGTTSWKSICTNLSSPYACSWVTSTGFANGDYDLRAVATSGATTTFSAVISGVLVDNAAPSVTMLNPGSPLAGLVTFEATATDADSGVAQVVLQTAVNGSSTWRDLCTVTSPPFSCRYDTTQVLDGTYNLRAVATDVAGNVAVSSTVTGRVVDNTVSSVSMTDPGAFLSGTVDLTAAANSSAGVTSVRIQRATSGTTTWTDVCTDSTSPYTCSWNTTTVTDGLYDFRAILVDGSGKVTTSATVAARRVDNSPLRGMDVQSANGGATAGKLENGDTVTFTYTDQVNPATVTPGWTGAATAVTLRVRDGNLLGLGNKGDTLDVLRTGGAVNLGAVNLKEDYLKSNKTATFNATMTASTTTVNGTTVSVVTLRLGTLASGGGLRTVSLASAMVWSPSSAVTDLYGVACSTAPATETGAADREF